MNIQVDTREHAEQWERIKSQFDDLGVSYFRSKMYVGDYQSLDNPRLVIDRKQDLQELCGNVTSQHERFKAELMRANKNEIKVVILCEDDSNISCLEDIFFWDNPRLKIKKLIVVNGRPMKVNKYPKATTGVSLYRSLKTISNKYNVDFRFCTKDKTGETIVKILGGEL